MFVWIIDSADDALLHLPQGGVDAQSGYQKSVVIQKWLVIAGTHQTLCLRDVEIR